jgi:hypothetical protein
LEGPVSPSSAHGPVVLPGCGPILSHYSDLYK